jgi:transcriptional regulator with XRE-family HTH domain
MDFVRIGDKIVNRAKIDRAVDKILELRCQGLSQQDVANKMSIDRTFVSRLEGLGEVRKGGSIAIVGFPVGNKEEIEEVARQEGVDFTLLMTDLERWEFVKQRDGNDLFNEIMRLIYEVRKYDTVILMGSDARLQLMRGLLDKEVITIVLGQTPIVGDVRVDPAALRSMLRALRTETAGEFAGKGE